MSHTNPTPPTKPIPRHLAYTCGRCGARLPWDIGQPCPQCHPVCPRPHVPGGLVAALCALHTAIAVLYGWAVRCMAGGR
jgi:hypothetical protein